MGGGQEPPDEKEDLKEKLAMLHVGVNYYELEDQFMQDGAMQPEFAARWASDVVKDIDKLANFILNLRKSESVNFEDSAPPLDTEELEKQVQAIKKKAKRRFHDDHDDGDLAIAEAVRELTTLFTQHTKVAVDALRALPITGVILSDGFRHEYVRQEDVQIAIEQLGQRNPNVNNKEAK